MASCSDAATSGGEPELTRPSSPPSRRFTVGNPSMRRPPPINPRDPSSDLFDSCVDNWVDPQIYVIFNDDQSYPYFIIHYEEVPSTVAV